MPRITHFDIPADDTQRAQTFYCKVFDWEFTKWDGPIDYWMAKTGDKEPGINGGLSKRQPGQMGMLNTISVPSIVEFSKKVTDQGGEVIISKMAIPKVGWYAQCTDTEGNMFGIIEIDQEAQ